MADVIVLIVNDSNDDKKTKIQKRNELTAFYRKCSISLLSHSLMMNKLAVMNIEEIKLKCFQLSALTDNKDMLKYNEVLDVYLKNFQHEVCILLEEYKTKAFKEFGYMLQEINGSTVSGERPYMLTAPMVDKYKHFMSEHMEHFISKIKPSNNLQELIFKAVLEELDK